MLKIKRDLDLIYDKSESFFYKKEVKSPLLGFFILGRNYMHTFSRTYKNISDKKVLQPEDINIKDFVKDVEDIINLSEDVAEDIFFPVSPFQYVTWMEAIIGCPIFVGKESLYSVPFARNLKDHDFYNVSVVKNKWMEKLTEIFKILLDFTGDKYPLSCSTHMRGPADMVSAAMGPTALCLELNDNPEKMKKLINYYSELFIETAAIQHDIVADSKFNKGYTVSGYGILTPLMCQHVQDDAIAILSPGIYREFFLEAHQKIISSFQSSFYHIHPVSLFIIEELVKIKKLDIIEINREPVPIGPSMDILLPYFKKIQENNISVFVHFTDVDFSIELIEKEVKIVMDSLNKSGLCINICIDNVKDGLVKKEAVKKILEKY
ncbi:MAG: hypothetical protein FJW56_11895 [Actinobacteria bacterium]|nr:hypothetical protein [Actinomycetota bacterium]